MALVGFPANSTEGNDSSEVGLVAPVTMEDSDDWSKPSLEESQGRDPEIAEFCDLLKQFPDRKPTWNELKRHSKAVKILWTMWSEFKFEENVLYRKVIDPVTQD